MLCGICRVAAMASPSRPTCPKGMEAVACGPELTPPLRALVHALKYSGIRKAAPQLVDLAHGSLPDGFLPSDAVLVPVPLHPHRLRERGYNQSELIARQWAGRCGLPVESKWMRRTRETSTQTRLSATERATNLAGAFETTGSFRKGVPVVLVDDVLTTGSTLSACASRLLAAGAPSVRGLCVAWAGEA